MGLQAGYHRQLELTDIWSVNRDRSLSFLVDRLEASFEKHVARGSRHPLLWATYDTSRIEFLVGGGCQLLAALMQVFSPFTTRYLINFASETYVAHRTGTPAPEVGKGVGLVIGIVAMQVCQSMGMNQFFYRGMIAGGQTRAALINIIFTKATKLSNRARAGGKAVENHGPVQQEQRHGLINKILRKDPGPKVMPDAAPGVAGDGAGWSNGRIMTLMSIDTDRVDKGFGMFHLMWTSPIVVILTLILLAINIGYSCLSGYALLVVMMPLLTHALKSLIKRRRRINKVTDSRVSLTQEILQAVRFVKFFGWESSFLQRLEVLRRQEISATQVVLAIRNAIMGVSMSLPVFASMLSFITFSLSSHTLTAAPIFSSLALFNALRLPLSMLPLVLGQVIDAWASLGRIQEFLLAEEQQETFERDPNMKPAIMLDGASFTWERAAIDSKQDKSKTGSKGTPNSPLEESATKPAIEPFQLRDLSIAAGRNELIAVIGGVGCGKSSLLSALAGEMRKTAGGAWLNASRAFCPQYAWLQNATVRDNVLFGRQWDAQWYDAVVDACALRADLAAFQDGDATEIGERGITVSGGQKQRLNIARAIYFDAELVLMDDPLSAVDAHVGRHIMDNAICGLLKNKCRILATHQLHVLSRCDRIVVMNKGKIEEIDTFENLMVNSETFRELMASTAQEARKEEGEEEKEEKEEKEKLKSSEKPAIAEQPKINEPKTENPEKAEPIDESKRSEPKQSRLMQAEERATDSVSWRVWTVYISAFGRFGFLINLPLLLLSLVLCNGGNIVTSLWLSWWTSNKFALSTGEYIGIYAALAGIQVLLTFTFSTLITTSGTNASRTMFARAMRRVLRAPMSFFDTTPLGRITNRFSKDVQTMDNELTDAMRIFYLTFTMIISVMVLIIVFFHYFAAALAPLAVMFLLATSFYRASARELKRYEALLRSTVFAQFSEAVLGISTIRAYGLAPYFSQRLRASLDEMDGAYFLTFGNQRWLSVRLDAIGNLMVLVTGLLVVTDGKKISPSIAGLVLSYILSIVGMLQFTIRQLAEVENDMNSTERIHYYGTQLPQEAPLHVSGRGVSATWPEMGAITFDNVRMRYRPELPLVLRDLTLDIRGGERVGIVGRTGAGKSSIMAALFRLTELTGGRIMIDGVDIGGIGLHDLRSRLAIIPQDPALFRGTVRSNLDPFEECRDEVLWEALRKANLVPTAGSTPGLETESKDPCPDVTATTVTLKTPVEEDGLNFSLGQRQLMALARALVRGSRIIVCDEATSSVDFVTDARVQRAMAEGFSGCTLLCIAHRLRTILAYDRIVVMEGGRVAEVGGPKELFETGGVFTGMCVRSGITETDFEEPGEKKE